MNKELKFRKQRKSVKDQMIKANNLLRYMNNIGKGMEINTAIIMYKSLVRSIFDYESYIYFPELEKQREKLEKAQFIGLRTAMGYRNSTPKNVILEEAKEKNLRARAVILTKNIILRYSIYGKEEIRNKI